MNYDQDALYSLPSAPVETPVPHATCCTCGRKMHKTALQPGAATQWHHDSTGHAISWSPSRHSAAVLRVKVHAHRWHRSTPSVKVLSCLVAPCDAEMLAAAHTEAPEALSEKQLHIAESRRRGGESRRAQMRAKGTA